MLDKLFNRKEMEAEIELLKKQINNLEIENKSLSKRLIKNDDRTKKAISDKQSSDLSLNKAEKKIKMLEHELKNLKERVQNPDGVSFKKSITLTNTRSSEMLFKIGSIQSKNESLLTIYLSKDKSISDLFEFECAIDLDKDVKYLLQRIRSETGFALFYDMNQLGGIAIIVLPPFPITESEWKLDNSFNITPIQEILDSNWTVCTVLAHAGETFIGVLNQEMFIDYKIVRSSVKEKHTKGGWSQGRFDRLREEDIKHHIDKAKDEFEFLINENEVKMVVASGDQGLAHEIIKDLNESNYKILNKNVDVKFKKHKIDKESIRTSMWSSKWYELP